MNKILLTKSKNYFTVTFSIFTIVILIIIVVKRIKVFYLQKINVLNLFCKVGKGKRKGKGGEGGGVN